MDEKEAFAIPSTEEQAASEPKVKPKEKSQAEAKHIQGRTDFLDGAQSLVVVVVLCLCCVVSFSSRLFAIIRFESIIHEFDPW